MRDFQEAGACLIMATRLGLVKKTALTEHGRPKRGGIIAVNLSELLANFADNALSKRFVR